MALSSCTHDTDSTNANLQVTPKIPSTRFPAHPNKVMVDIYQNCNLVLRDSVVNNGSVYFNLYIGTYIIEAYTAAGNNQITNNHTNSPFNGSTCASGDTVQVTPLGAVYTVTKWCRYAVDSIVPTYCN